VRQRRQALVSTERATHYASRITVVKVLILKPSSLGDVVQALPVLRLIKLHHPTSEIHWWVDASLAPLLEGDPDLAGVILFHRRRWASPLRWGEAWRSLRTIQAHRFDWVIDLQSLMRSGLVAWLAGGGLTVGLDDPREGARTFYDIIVPRPSCHTHAVDWYLGVLPMLDVPVHRNFSWMPERSEAGEAVRSKWCPDSDRWVALQPGARWLNKRWPVSHFTELVRLLAQRFSNVRFVILGGEADRELGGRIGQAASERCLDLTGRATLPEMVEWIRLCELMITNDTGPMHVAAALNKPMVALFGPTEPRRTGPYGQLHHVLQHGLPCVPCMKDSCSYHQPFECLRAITPERVASCSAQILESYGRPRALNRAPSAHVD
jgi:lipopolysaccharide heptosyltransferase I